MANMQATFTRCGIDSISPVYTQVESTKEDFLQFFNSKFRIDIVSDSDEELVFDMVGADAPIANALRRILLAEVPSVALETIYISKNTSIIQDEILAHRLGLIPLRVDPRKVDMMQPSDDATDLNTMVFAVDTNDEVGSESGAGNASSGTSTGGIAGRPLGGGEDDEEADAEGNYRKVYSKSIVWAPQGGQVERFASRPGPVHDDILLAKLAPGQCIVVEAYAMKGIGKDHAKFSPVSTAAYRLLPVIRLSTTAPFLDSEAEALVAKCPMGVFDIEDIAGGGRQAVVARPRNCTFCRECVREPGWDERVTLLRDNQHFIFSIESTGCMPARSIFLEAVRILSAKARGVLTASTGDIPDMPAGQVAMHTQAAMRSPEEEEN